jgi:hypothetical protein
MRRSKDQGRHLCQSGPVTDEDYSRCAGCGYRYLTTCMKVIREKLVCIPCQLLNSDYNGRR